MTKILTIFELSLVVEELKELIGARLQKIYLLSPKEMLLGLHLSGVGNLSVKVDSGVGCYLTEYKLATPLEPSGFCLQLRKYINGTKLKDIEKRPGERIVEFIFEKDKTLYRLICELFSKGNFVLTDKDYKILTCASIQKWKDRTVRPGEIYLYPPSQGIDYEKFSSKDLIYLLKNTSRENIGSVFAADLGIGSLYALEICSAVGVEQSKKVSLISKEESDALFKSFKQILIRKISPSVIIKDGKPIDATPFKLFHYKGMEYKSFPTFNSALDYFYTENISAEITKENSAKYDSKKEKLMKILDAQKESLEKYKTESEKARKLADLIYRNYSVISDIIIKINGALKQGYKFDELKRVLEKEKAQGIYEANIIKDIKPETREVVLDLGEDIVINIRKSIEENAGVYYDEAKRFKSKISGALETITKYEKQLAELSIAPEIKKGLPVKKEEIKKAWYEKFHWFYTGSRLLALGGRDATTNEILIKKYLEVYDIVFHTDLVGSPFFVIKNPDNKTISDKDKEEVAIATVSFSRAWREGLGTAEVYWVRPEQISKSAESGEFISKGAFMIRGKRNYVPAVTQLAIGLLKDKIMIGAESAVAKYCKKIVEISPGDVKTSDVAKEIAHSLGLGKEYIDEIVRVLPAGGCRITTS